MRRAWLIGGAALALTSSLALAAPQSLLPPSFGGPPTPTPSAAPVPAPTPLPTVAPRPIENPDGTTDPSPAPAAPGFQSFGDAFSVPIMPDPVVLPDGFPSLEELEKMEPGELDELFGLKPRYDIPPSARREAREIGLLARNEGGMPLNSLVVQPASLVRATIEGTRGPLVSRWGHIMLRRVLASRLEAPEGMDPVDFAAMRAGLLVRLGEGSVARSLVQDVDSANYNAALTDAAFAAYLATGDLLGMCPVAILKHDLRDDPEWEMTKSICAAYAGDTTRSKRELDSALNRQIAPRIDVLLAQRFGGAAGDGQRAVEIEWDDVSSLTPWRYSLALALGVQVPDGLRSNAGKYYSRVSALSPALSLQDRAAAADLAAEEGILSSKAMVDLYGQIAANNDITGEWAERSSLLRAAYVGASPDDRLAAMRTLWGGDLLHGRQVLTSYAAARMPVSPDYSDDAFDLLASMLAAGLDQNAMLWASQAPDGSAAWALLALANPASNAAADRGAVDSFIDNDDSDEQRKSSFLVAGLAGLDRLDSGSTSDFASRLDMDLSRETRWSRYISMAADANNQTLVALLAGVGMQGDNWDKMTGRHLYHIVSSLRRVGLEAEARMIAAEAVARG